MKTFSTALDGHRRVPLFRPIAVVAAGVSLFAQIGASRAAELTLPASIEQALQENARNVSPLSVKFTSRTDTGNLRIAVFVDGKDVTATTMPRQLVPNQSLHVVWQDPKLYMAQQDLPGKSGDMLSQTLTELTFDGRVFARGNIPNASGAASIPAKNPAAGARRNGMPNPADLSRRELLKEPVAKALPMLSTSIAENPYFCPHVGLVISLDSQSMMSGGRLVEQKLRAESTILASLHNGGTLVSVSNVTLDGKQCVRIVLDAPRAAANGAVEAGNLNQKNAAPKPKARRYVYYLDPERHYAVRRLEQRFEPDILLDRTDCSQFVQIPGRPLWLPRRLESELHELPTMPGAVFKEASTQIVEVSAIDGGRVPDETFALNDTQPGTIVHDGTDPAAAKSKRGHIRYIVPSRPEDLPGVIEKARKAEEFADLGGAPPTVESRHNNALVAIVLCNLALLGTGAGYLAWRRRRGTSI